MAAVMPFVAAGQNRNQGSRPNAREGRTHSINPTRARPGSTGRPPCAAVAASDQSRRLNLVQPPAADLHWTLSAIFVEPDRQHDCLSENAVQGLNMWTEQDDTEPDYGFWEFTAAEALAEDKKRNPVQPPPDILPDWSDGVPTLVRWTGWTERFWKDNVRYAPRSITTIIEYGWCPPQNLGELVSRHSRLPSTSHWEWSGVYRLFVEGEGIDRLLGKDPTGTLYVGMAGHGSGQWSILRNRIMGLATGRNHHVADRWLFNEKLEQRYPWKTLMIQWAFTERRTNYKGEETSGARGAESWLLSTYRDSFGEFPPMNEKA